MPYSLLSRFRGTLLGAAIAEGLGFHQGRSKTGLNPLWNGELGSHLCESQDQCFCLNQVAWLSTQTLIKVGDLDIESLKYLRGRQQTHAMGPLTPAETLVGIIPVSLFFHEDEARLRQKILQATEAWHTPLELQYGALTVAYVIAQSLREQLDPATLVARTIAYLPQPPDLLVKQLEQVQMLLEQRAALDTALSQLLQLQPSAPLAGSISIALAFYCFLSTLEDYRLTTVRAARIRHKSSLTAILAGALSGAYNSTAGIPSGYRLSLLQGTFPQDTERRKTESMILKLADQSLATWSGAYESTTALVGTDLSLEPAVAAPGVIRPR